MPRFHTARAVDNWGHEPAGGTPTGRGHEDDWWGQLYDSTDDTGPTPAPDTLDDRFASAAGAVRDGSGGGRLTFEEAAGEGRLRSETGAVGSRVRGRGSVVGGPALRLDPMMDRPGRRRDMVWISGTWRRGAVVDGPGRR